MRGENKCVVAVLFCLLCPITGARANAQPAGSDPWVAANGYLGIEAHSGGSDFGGGYLLAIGMSLRSGVRLGYEFSTFQGIFEEGASNIQSHALVVERGGVLADRLTLTGRVGGASYQDPPASGVILGGGALVRLFDFMRWEMTVGADIHRLFFTRMREPRVYVTDFRAQGFRYRLGLSYPRARTREERTEP